MRLMTIPPGALSRISVLSRFTARGPATWFDGLALTIAVVVALTVLRTPIGTGDYGQWLMVSRYYSGESVPAYRDISAIPPVMPLLLSVASRIFADPVLALNVVKSTLAFSFVAATYWAGTSIFRDKAAGLLGACFTFFVTDRMLELFAFGGLPQIGSLIFIALAMGCYGRALHAEKLEMRWWVFGAVAVFLAALTHAGTGVLAILSGGSVAVIGALKNPHLSPVDRVRALSSLAVLVLLLVPYWALVILPANREYVANVASLYYRGPWAFWKRLSANDLNLVVLGAGAMVTLIGAAWELARNRLGPYRLIATWALAVWGFFGLAVLAGVGTEYPRFQYPLLQPLALAVGGGIVWALRQWVPQARGEADQAWYLAPIAGLALTLMVAGPSTMNAFRREANTYRLPDLDGLIAGIEQVDARLSDDEAVVSTVGVGKWVEGITGRTALFSMPNRYSFREVEISRSLAAETLIRSTFTASDGQFFLRYTSISNEVPTYPWVAINHRGEYVDLVKLRPSEFQLLSQGRLVASLGSLEASDFEYVVDEYVVSLRSVFSGERQGEAVEVVQEAVLDKASNTLVITYEVTSPLAIDELRVSLAPVAEDPAAVNFTTNGIDLDFAERAKVQPRLMIRVPTDEHLAYDDENGQAVISAPGSSRLELSIAFEKSAPPINPAAVLWPQEIVEEYNIGAAFLPIDSAMETRRARLEALGFSEFGEVGSQIVLLRDGAAADLLNEEREHP